MLTLTIQDWFRGLNIIRADDGSSALGRSCSERAPHANRCKIITMVDSALSFLVNLVGTLVSLRLRTGTGMGRGKDPTDLLFEVADEFLLSLPR